MRTRIAVMFALLVLPGFVEAQVQPAPNSPNAPYAPNFYNRGNQPLSPYLNLLRGGNPAVNYFYGVRPGLMNGAFAGPSGAAGSNTMNRQSFFNQIDTLTDPDEQSLTPTAGIRPTGHPFAFNNTLGFFGGGGTGGGGQRGANQSPMANRRSMGGR